MMPPTPPELPTRAVTAASFPRVTRYSQRDPRWAKVLLNDGPDTLAEMGCLLTCLASILTDIGHRITPPQLNAWLIAHKGFERADWIKFGAVEPLGLRKVRVAENLAPAVPLAPLAKALKAGQYVIVFVDTPPGGLIASHWTRLVDADKWLIMDPARLPANRAIHKLRDYTAPHWTLAQAVKAYAIYEKSAPRSRSHERP